MLRSHQKLFQKKLFRKKFSRFKENHLKCRNFLFHIKNILWRTSRISQNVSLYTKEVHHCILLIPICRNEILIRPVTDFTLRLHEKIKFHPGKARQFCAWYLFRFAFILLTLLILTFSVRLGKLKRLHGEISSRKTGYRQYKRGFNLAVI